MLRLGEKKVTKEKFVLQKNIKIWDVHINNIVISKLIETKTNSKYLIVYLNKIIRSIVLITLKMSGCVKTFKVKDGNKDKNNKLVSSS